MTIPLPERPWSPRAALAGRRVLLTGVTGFVGKVLAVLLLDRVPEIGGLVLVARGKRRADAQARFREILATSPALRPLRERHGAGLPEFIQRRVEVVEGDVGLPFLDLTPEVRDRLRGTLDAVVHVAGITDFDPDPAQALRTNVLGARYAADLAVDVAGGRLLHVSTAFVAGTQQGEIEESIGPGRAPTGDEFDIEREIAALGDLCAAHELPSVRLHHARERAAALGWPNVYTYSKGLAEHHLAARDDLSLAIVRPSIVESARRFPLEGWLEGINTSAPIIWLLSGWLRALPSVARSHFDVVPVDDVARGIALVLAAHVEGRAPRVSHLGTSATNPLHFDRAIDLTALGARRIHGRSDASGVGRFVLRHLDAVPRPYDEAAYPLPILRRLVRGARDTLRDLDPSELLPPRWHRRFGADLADRRRRWTRECKNLDRTLGRVEEILRSYRPFTHDHDWVFRTDAIHALTAALPDDDREALGFDVSDLDWRRYWLDVQVPGVERYSWPLFDGGKAPVDPAPPWYAAEDAAGAWGAAEDAPGEAAE